MKPSVILELKRNAVRKLLVAFAQQTRASLAQCSMAPTKMVVTSIC
ncbi:hypothetical protein PTE_02834 [Photorhabdus khanii NC19]|uniref:Uncharacterized protein n=1 Tax=Photorhabdus khanii NC19 TaxID=1004151 RepID=W3V509_9GAMM|nr:hypothetical protein PTE_02834 [Photorhabdus khanii NC19]